MLTHMFQEYIADTNEIAMQNAGKSITLLYDDIWYNPAKTMTISYEIHCNCIEKVTLA